MWAYVISILSAFAKGGVQAFLISAGLSITVFAGLEVIVDGALGHVVSSIGGLPSAVYQFAMLSGLGNFVNITGSALLTRLALNAATSALGFSLKK